LPTGSSPPRRPSAAGATRPQSSGPRNAVNLVSV